MAQTALDQWLVRRMGWAGESLPTPEEVRAWQLARLREMVAHAQANSPFYRQQFEGVDASSIRSESDFSGLPMMTPDDVREGPERLLCVSQDDIARVVTLQSSGTTGQPKRIFHTQDDLEATADFFDWGMRSMIEPGQTALVLMPGERPGGVGRLLADAVGRFGACAVSHGVMEDAGAALEHVMAENAECIVGPSAHINLLACEWERRDLPQGQIKSVLLCWDAIPDSVVRNVERILGCRVYRHWGMIETGLGGAVECAPGSGMHVREPDVFLEIVDPRTGRTVPGGEFGEMVVSTPLRRGMPLIRYRTGDLGCIILGQCECGSPLRRLDPHVRRAAEGVQTDSGALRLTELNEVLYGVPGVGDFAAEWDGQVLRIRLSARESVREHAERALASMPVIAQGLEKNCMRIELVVKNDVSPAVPGLGKRRILEL